MAYVKKISMLILAGLITSGCSQCQTKLSFTELPMLSRTDTVGKQHQESITRIKHYLVENYCDNKEAERQIDSFAFKSLPPDFQEYSNYHLIFFKKTSNTSVEVINKYQKGVPPESLEDEIYEYWWLNGKFLSRHKFKNGRLVNSDVDNIKVIPVSKD